MTTTLHVFAVAFLIAFLICAPLAAGAGEFKAFLLGFTISAALWTLVSLPLLVVATS